MKHYFTSDLHHHHKRISEFCTWRPDSANVEYHSSFLIASHNKIVKDEDNFYHLGDFCFSSRVDVIVFILERMNGRKHLIRGNHCDKKAWRKIAGDKALCSRLKIEWIADYKKIAILDEETGKKQAIVMCHYPMYVWDGLQYGSYMLHGHSHGGLHGVTQGKILDVGLDAFDVMHGFADYWSFEGIREYMKGRQIAALDHHGRDV